MYGPWGAWSPCTSSCGLGTKTRHRRPIDGADEGSVNWVCRIQSVNCTSKIKSCEITPEDAESNIHIYIYIYMNIGIDADK